MNKKVAQQNTIDFKRDEINRVLTDTLKNLNEKMQAATQQLNEQVNRELNQIVTNLTKEIETKVNEIKSLVKNKAFYPRKAFGCKVTGGR